MPASPPANDMDRASSRAPWPPPSPRRRGQLLSAGSPVTSPTRPRPNIPGKPESGRRRAHRSSAWEKPNRPFPRIASPPPRRGAMRRMKTKLNGRFLIFLLLGLALLGGGMYLLRNWQLKRNAGALLDQAVRAEEQGDLASADDYLSRYLALRPDDLSAQQRHGLLLDRLATPPNPNGRLRAFLTLELVVRRQPDNNDLHRELVRIAMAPDLGRYGDAREHLDVLLRSS